MKENIKEFLIVFFLGFFGVHKFIDKNYKMGFLYLFTFGIFGIGWFVDVVKVLMKFNSTDFKSLMNSDALKSINSGNLVEIDGTNLNLSKDEKCYYADKAYTFRDKTVTTGYTNRHGGFSIRIMKGLSYHTGGSGSKAIKQRERTKYYGTLYITTKRVIYASTKDSFDKPLSKITSVQEAKDGIIIQSGSSTYAIVTKTHSEFMKVFNLVRQKND